MSYRGRLNLGLVAVLGAMISIQFGLPDESPAQRRVSEWRPDDIRTLALERDGRLVWRIERNAGTWRMQEPDAHAVDGGRVRVLLGILRTASLQQIPFDTPSLARYGLDRPQMRLVTDRAVLEFGRRESLTGGRYLRIGNEIHLIGDGYLPHLLAPAADWIEDAGTARTGGAADA